MSNFVIYGKRFLLLLFLNGFYGFAQGEKIEIVAENTIGFVKKNLAETSVQLLNNSDSLFEGKLLIHTPEGIKSISGTTIDVAIPPQGKKFLPLKFLIQSSAEAGKKELSFTVLDSESQEITQHQSTIDIQEIQSMYFSVQDRHLRITNPNDSIRIRATVSNKGNKTQEVIVLFGIPEKRGNKYYVEKKGNVRPDRDSVFVFSFLPDQEVLNNGFFTVSVAGMYSKGKLLFGNAMVEVQNVSSSKTYTMHSSLTGSSYQTNTITAAYRQIDDNYTIAQFMGGTAVDLPAGSLSLHGNLQKSNSWEEWLATGTYMAYRLEGSEIQVGNMSKSLHRTFFGRGISVDLSGKQQDKSIAFGMIDNQYNLVAENPFFDNGYAFYAEGQFGKNNSGNIIKTTYSFQDDPFERAKINTIGGEYQKYFAKNWSVNAKLYGALSDYHLQDKQTTTLAADVQYTGQWNDYHLSGSYFYSDPYFPGDRRGATIAQQSVRKKTQSDYLLYARAMYMSFSPRSYTNRMTMENHTLLGDLGVSLPKTGNFSLGFGYQYQLETSNSYAELLAQNQASTMEVISHRLTESIGWGSRAAQHSAFLTLDNGFSKHPFQEELNLQLRANLSYQFKSFSLSGMYQYGAFYLHEYFQTMAYGKSIYKRLTANIRFTETYFDNNLTINAGVAYNKDYLWGQAPSGFLSVIQNISKRTSVFFNGSWFEYNGDFIPASQTYTLEAGLTVNLDTGAVSDKRKSKITVFVYHDNNGNDIYDQGDQPAVGYYITMNNIAFVTDLDGKFVYKSVPFGNYLIRSSSHKGWFHSATEVEVSRFKTNVSVALKQMGTLSGKIQYSYDAQTMVDFIAKTEGISFKITQNDKHIQRVFTKRSGEFIAFLPKGDYQIELETSTLPADVFCEKTVQTFSVTSGKMTKLPDFILQVKQRKVNLKKFGE